MAQMTQFSDLYPFIRRWVKGCEPQFILRALQDAVRHLTEVYEVWVEDMDPIAVVDYQQDYTLTTPYSNSFVHRIKQLKVNGQVYGEEEYDLYRESRLRFNTVCVPHDLDDLLLVCATSPKILYTDWTGITDGSVGMTIGSSSYDITSLNFSACTTMDQVALVIQTGLRTEREDNNGLVRWFTNHFKFWLDAAAGEVSYLTAGSAGTDISGASYMNGLTGAGVLSGLLEIKVVLRSHQSAATLPSWLFDRFSDALIARAIWQLKTQPGPYQDGTLSQIWDTEFRIQLAKVIGETSRGYKNKSRGMSA